MKHSLILILAIIAFHAAYGQRRVSPVKTPATVTQSRNGSKRDSLDRSRLIEMHDANGNVILVDTVTGKEVVDSTAMPTLPKMIYPLLHSASVSVDLWSPLMRLFNTKYGLISFAGQVSLHNRYIPTFEIGLGKADYTPEDNNYTYKSPMSIYFKLGADYNFLYNSNPDYFFYAGFRYGFTPFSYRLTDVTINDNYWGTQHTVDMPSQKSTAGYLELLIGLRVKLFKSWSMGWSVRYHTIMHQSKNTGGDPWYIPGFGTKGSALSASFSLYYTLPLDKKKPEVLPGSEAADNAVNTPSTQ